MSEIGLSSRLPSPGATQAYTPPRVGSDRLVSVFAELCLGVAGSTQALSLVVEGGELAETS